ncbi:PilZ domain-containing protein [Candidatus Korobacter versatilis]|nr:PilZ domain-containing protein [Candidatus Koribacter versatilis]
MPSLNPFAAFRSKSEKDRQFHRHKIDVAVRIKAWRGGAFQLMEGRGSDVSQGGMALSISTALQLGESVTIEVTLPYSEHPLMLTGVVRNIEDERYGMEFTGLREQQREAITRLCEALEKSA